MYKFTLVYLVSLDFGKMTYGLLLMGWIMTKLWGCNVGQTGHGRREMCIDLVVLYLANSKYSVYSMPRALLRRAHLTPVYIYTHDEQYNIQYISIQLDGRSR